MWLFAVETSGRTATVALSHDGSVVAERELSDAGRRHAQTLLSEIDAVCAEQRLKPRDVGAVAVSIGPGSFTGLRVGVVFAKTFCYAVGCPLIAVETLLAAAEQCPTEIDSAWTLADAQRGDVYVARYQRVDADRWDVADEIRVRPSAEWLAERSSGESVTGPGVDRLDPGEASSRDLILIDPELRQPTASTIARIAHRKLAAGIMADPWSLEPFYLRKPAAEEKLATPSIGP